MFIKCLNGKSRIKILRRNRPMSQRLNRVNDQGEKEDPEGLPSGCHVV